MSSLFFYVSLLECYLQPRHSFLAHTWPLSSAGVLAALVVCLVSATLFRVLNHMLRSSSSYQLALTQALQPMQWDLKIKQCRPSNLLMDHRASLESHTHELRHAICTRHFKQLSLGPSDHGDLPLLLSSYQFPTDSCRILVIPVESGGIQRN